MERGPLSEADITAFHHEEKKTQQEHPLGKPTEQQEEAFRVALEIKDSIAEILGELKGKISRGEYSLIIGDDSSGRIPAEVIYETIKRVYDEKGFDEPRITFVTSTRYDYDGEHANAIARHLTESGYEPEEGKRALIATESMASGRSIEVLIKALKEDGFDCDVATLNNCSNGFLEKLKLRFRDGVTLADGIKGSHRSIIDRHDMAGVEKQDDEAVVSKRYEDYGHDQELVNATRHAVDTLSAVLAEEFLKEVA